MLPPLLSLASTSSTKVTVKVDQVSMNVKLPTPEAFHCRANVEVTGETTQLGTYTMTGCWCRAIFVWARVASLEWHCPRLVGRLLSLVCPPPPPTPQVSGNHTVALPKFLQQIPRTKTDEEQSLFNGNRPCVSRKKKKKVSSVQKASKKHSSFFIFYFLTPVCALEVSSLPQRLGLSEYVFCGTHCMCLGSFIVLGTVQIILHCCFHESAQHQGGLG